MESPVSTPSTPVSMKRPETEDAELQAPEFGVETVPEKLSSVPIVRLPPSTTPYKNVDSGSHLALLDGLYRHVRNLRVDSGHREEIFMWRNPVGIFVTIPYTRLDNKLCPSIRYVSSEVQAKELRVRESAERKRYALETQVFPRPHKKKGGEFENMRRILGPKATTSNIDCRTVLVYYGRTMSADEIITQLFDPRDSSKIISISPHAGHWEQSHVRTVHFASTETMLGVLARNPTPEVKMKHPELRMVPDLPARWMRAQNISVLLDFAESSNSGATLGQQAIRIASRIIYIVDNRADKFSSADALKLEAFMPEDAEKIVNVQYVDQAHWIVHFETPGTVSAVLQRMKDAKWRTKRVRMHRFWYHELQARASQAASSGTTRLVEQSVATEVSRYEKSWCTRPNLSRYEEKQVVLHEEQKRLGPQQPESANTSRALTQKVCETAGDVSSDDEFFECSEVLPSR